MRINALDCLRGLLILYIVTVIHGIFWLNIAPEAIGSLLLFEMPAIFVIAGYAYFLFEQNSPALNQRTLGWKTYSSFVLARTFRLLLPYFVYVIVCIVMIEVYDAVKGDETILLHELAVRWLNPFTYGGYDPHSMLDNHLWFVHVFLLVTLAMPLVTKLRCAQQLNLLLVITAVALILFALSSFAFMREETIKHTFFYLCFSLLGYYLGRANAYFEKIDFIQVGVFCGLALLMLSIVGDNSNLLYMQLNKFPPNHIFFLFNCIWMSFFLHITFKHPNVFSSIDWIQHNPLFKPFMQYGYSIFLWQGIGYSLAMTADKYYAIPLIIVWVMAVGLSVLLGWLFGPIEKMRIRLKTD
ncbi:MAG: acyltransferase family protein [Methylophilus sp.]|nr:acyltransferase family protein [Methylophilus sp.]